MRGVSLAKRLLAGTSVVALTLASTPDSTSAETFTGSGPSSVTSPVNFLILDNYFSYGRFTNKTYIGPATLFPIALSGERIALWIRGTSTFGSDILNQAGASIVATDLVKADRDRDRNVTALRSDATVPIINEGLISAKAMWSFENSRAIGVLLNGSGELANYGTVEAFTSGSGNNASFGVNANTSTWIFNYGSISAQATDGGETNRATAVALNAGGTLVNSGTLKATSAEGNATGVSITGQGLLQNNSSVWATARGETSLSSHGVSAKGSSVLNAGEVISQAIGGPGTVFVDNAETVEASASGVLASRLENSGAVVVIGRADAAMTFHFDGPNGTVTVGNPNASAKAVGASAESIINKNLIYSEAISNALTLSNTLVLDNGTATATAETIGLDGSQIENTRQGLISAAATATANTWGQASAAADVVGITSAKDKDNTLKNSAVSGVNAGTLSAVSRAFAYRDPSIGVAGDTLAESVAVGVHQNADTTIFNTSGAFVVRSESTASLGQLSSDQVTSHADALGIRQLVSYFYLNDTETPVVFFNNTGQLSVSASATSERSRAPSVAAEAGGVLQEHADLHYVTPGNLVTTNSGRIAVLASASASPEESTAGAANASATGITQRFFGVDNVASVDNTGSIIVGARGQNGGAVDVSSIGINQGSQPFSPPGTTHLAKVSNKGLIEVLSEGVGGTVDAVAIGIRQNPLTDGAVANAGKLDVQALSASDSDAVANVTGIQQHLQFGSSMVSTVENQGIVTAAGVAGGVGTARIDILGVSQRGGRNLAMENVGTLETRSIAAATGTVVPPASSEDPPSSGNALAEAYSTAIFQQHSRGDIVQRIGNSGTVRSSASSRASNLFSAVAKSVADAIGAHQTSTGTVNSSADLALINIGALGADASASSPGSPFAEDRVRGEASASATGVYQFADNPNANRAFLDNKGTVSAAASGSTGVSVTGSFKTASGEVTTKATGVAQQVTSNAKSIAEIANRGNISVISESVSTATALQANALAEAFGVAQSADSLTEANAFLINDGAISARASVATESPVGGFATARATGVKQSLDSGSQFQSVNNSGSISAVVTATATGPDSIALGASRGVDVQADGLLPLAILNSGAGSVSSRADATAGSIANAFADGIYVASDTVGGSITNLGTITAFAKATSTDAADGGISRAIGIHDPSGTNDLTITNYGTIAAYAEANTEAGATAIKIMTDEEGAGQEESDTSLFAGAQMPAALALGPVTTIINDNGVLYAGYSLDGGVTVHRGLAIDTTLAPNPVAVLLSGGYILGDIELTADDTITMTEPTVILGNLNASASELAIEDGQKLTWLVGTEATDPANFFGLPAFSDSAPMTMTLGSFVVEAGSTLSLRGLTPDLASMPSIDATTASLHGTLALGFGPGLFQDVTVFENLITAGTLDGAFSDIIDNSVLLDPSAANDGNSIDLSVTRLPFDGVAGLTGNQYAVAESIEGVYPTLGGGSDFEQAVGHLFTLNSADYASFLDQLTGAEYAQYLQAVLWSTRPVQNLITDRMECAGGTSIYVAPEGAAVDEGGKEDAGCFTPGHGSVWLRAYGAGNSLDGDERAPGFFENQFGLLIGADYSFDGNWFAGAAMGYRSSDMKFDDWGGRAGTSIDYDGLQLAAYGGYDDGAAYARAILGYGNYEGESHRLIQFDTSPVDPSGDLSSSVWSAYAEAGRRLAVSDDFSVTPFVGLSYARAHLDGFTESDPEGTGVALEIDGANAASLATRLGVRLETDIDVVDGTVTPVLALGWEHEFKDAYQTLDMSFADAPSGTEFEVSGSKSPRDSLAIDAGVRFAGDNNFEGGVFYTGLVNEDYASHGATIRFGFRF